MTEPKEQNIIVKEFKKYFDDNIQNWVFEIVPREGEKVVIKRQEKNLPVGLMEIQVGDELSFTNHMGFIDNIVNHTFA